MLLLGAIVAAGAALPFATQKPTGLISTVQVQIPATLPIPNLGPANFYRPPLTALRLSDYIEDDFSGDVFDELEDVADEVQSVDATQKPDLVNYTVNATADDADAARDAAATAAGVLIERSNALSAEIVEQVEAAVQTAVSSLEPQIEQLQTRADVMEQRISKLKNEAVAARINRGKLVEARAGDARLNELDERIDQLAERLLRLAPQATAIDSQLDLLKARRRGFVAQGLLAEQIQLARRVGSTMVSPPSTPTTGGPIRLVSILFAAAALGTLVAALLVLLISRRRGRHPDGSVPPPPPSDG